MPWTIEHIEECSMKFGVDLQRCNPRSWVDLAQNAEDLGFESLWVAEHLIFPREIATGPADDHVKVDPSLPLFDPFVVLATLGAQTETIRLGTNIFNIGLRHPFVTARSVATTDLMTNGRITLGVGSSWLRQEWDAVELDFDSRGARVDEAIDICERSGQRSSSSTTANSSILRRSSSTRNPSKHGSRFTSAGTAFEH